MGPRAAASFQFLRFKSTHNVGDESGPDYALVNFGAICAHWQPLVAHSYGFWVMRMFFPILCHLHHRHLSRPPELVSFHRALSTGARMNALLHRSALHESGSNVERTGKT